MSQSFSNNSSRLDFVATDVNFSSKLTGVYLKFMLGAPVICFFAVSFVYGMIYHPLKGRHKAMEEAVLVFLELDALAIVLTTVASVLLAFVLYIYHESQYRERELIVGITFNDEQRRLTVKTKKILGQELTQTYGYDALTLQRNKLADGLTRGEYSTITLSKGEYWVGHVYLNHFAWSHSILAQLRRELEKRFRYR